MDSANLVVGSVYSVEVYPERIYGKTLTDVTFLGRVDASIVSSMGVIPSVEHKKVYSTLPDGVPNAADQYSWLLFKSISGNTIIIGEPWIVANSITGGDEVDIWDVTGIKGNSNTPERISQVLSMIGIYEYNITKRT